MYQVIIVENNGVITVSRVLEKSEVNQVFGEMYGHGLSDSGVARAYVTKDIIQVLKIKGLFVENKSR